MLYFKQKVLSASSFRDVESAKAYPTVRETYFDGVVDDEEDDFVPLEIDIIP